MGARALQELSDCNGLLQAAWQHVSEQAAVLQQCREDAGVPVDVSE